MLSPRARSRDGGADCIGHAAILTFLFRRPPLVYRRTPDAGGALEPSADDKCAAALYPRASLLRLSLEHVASPVQCMLFDDCETTVASRRAALPCARRSVAEFTRCTDVTYCQRLGISNACQLLFPFVPAPGDARGVDPSLARFLDLLVAMDLLVADPETREVREGAAASPRKNKKQFYGPCFCAII